MIRLGTPDDLAAVARVHRSASLSNEGDRENLLAHPEYLVMGPEALIEGRTYVAERDGAVVGFATWADPDPNARAESESAGAGAGATTARTRELEDLFVDPAWMRRGIATDLIGHIAEVLRGQGAQCLAVTANPDALGFYRSAGFVGCGVAETPLRPAPRMLLTIG
jgi:GNAT superfamily N-acetyltransferase